MVEYRDWVAAMMKAHSRSGSNAQQHNRRVMSRAAKLWNEHKEQIRAMSKSDALEAAKRQ